MKAKGASLVPVTVTTLTSTTTTKLSAQIVQDMHRHLTLARSSWDILPSLLLAMLFVTAAPFVLPITLVSLLPFLAEPTTYREVAAH